MTTDYTSKLSGLKDQVGDSRSPETATSTLLNGIAGLINDAGQSGDPQDVRDLGAAIRANSSDLCKQVAAVAERSAAKV